MDQQILALALFGPLGCGAADGIPEEQLVEVLGQPVAEAPPLPQEAFMGHLYGVLVTDQQARLHQALHQGMDVGGEVVESRDLAHRFVGLLIDLR